MKLVYLHKKVSGGIQTYTYHLVEGLKELGHEVEVAVVGKRPRNFGYGITAAAYSVDDLEMDDDLLIIVSIDEYAEIVQQLFMIRNSVGLETFIVVHDPKNITKKRKEALLFTENEQIITIRKSVQSLFPGSLNMLHPYKREFTYTKFEDIDYSLRNLASGRSRIDYTKNSHILFEAREEVPIDIHGVPNRRYIFTSIQSNWEYVDKKFPYEVGLAQKIASRYIFDLDFTTIKEDGGGTQYTFLEAIDAGCVPILHSQWLDHPLSILKENENCLCISDSKELVEILKNFNGINQYKHIIDNNFKLLENYNYIDVAKEFLTLIGD